ncbi:hypothetical protein G3O06_13835 [Burkholderia sp. Ac-20345]|uniref:hypothetical protein n=1 Tax=Burkholderia sp. Ac-20345 TaxID=2703891 RepID=UPI00197B0DF0|nr:hypothetical protein [Burkholderia sp. Ac-20345]MBN3778626.1 hypothetical protein [Burkholderia sp. Ac-20345]
MRALVGTVSRVKRIASAKLHYAADMSSARAASAGWIESAAHSVALRRSTTGSLFTVIRIIELVDTWLTTWQVSFWNQKSCSVREVKTILSNTGIQSFSSSLTAIEGDIGKVHRLPHRFGIVVLCTYRNLIGIGTANRTSRNS